MAIKSFNFLLLSSFILLHSPNTLTHNTDPKLRIGRAEKLTKESGSLHRLYEGQTKEKVLTSNHSGKKPSYKDPRNYLSKPLAAHHGLLRILQSIKNYNGRLKLKTLSKGRTPAWNSHGSYNEHAEDNISRMDRSYYGWMDFGKRSIDNDDYEY